MSSGDDKLSYYNKNIDLEKVVATSGWEKQASGSSSKYAKYRNGDTKIVINKMRNTYFYVPGDNGGSVVEFVKNEVVGDSNNWKAIFDRLAEFDGSSNDYQVSEYYDESSRFSTADRKRIETYLNKYNKPAGAHPYLVNVRMISPDLLKQRRFRNCIRTPSNENDKYKNANIIHRDLDGPCAYERHNVGLVKNTNILSKNSKKSVWFTDDFYDQTTDTIFIGEAVIDCLSVATLLMNDPEKQNMALMSCGGSFDLRVFDDKEKTKPTESNEMVNMFKTMFSRCHAKKIIIGNDNDHAGYAYDEFYTSFFATHFPGKFDVTVEKPPMQVNDWNNYLAVESFNESTKYLRLAKTTNELVIVEGGVGKFRLIPSEKRPDAVIMVIPPAGFSTSNLNSLVTSFMYVMKKHNDNSIVTFTPSKNGKLSYAKALHEWRKEFLPSLEYKKSNYSNPLNYLLKNGRLTDEAIMNTWNGFTQITKKPHHVAKYTSKIIITSSDDESTKYYHSSYAPLTTIIAVPNNNVVNMEIAREKSKQRSALNNPNASDAEKSISNSINQLHQIMKHASITEAYEETMSFIELTLKNSNGIQIEYSPCLNAKNKLTFAHCVPVNNGLQQLQSQLRKQEQQLINKGNKQDKLRKLREISNSLANIKCTKGELPDGCTNLLTLLKSKGLLVTSTRKAKPQKKPDLKLVDKASEPRPMQPRV